MINYTDRMNRSPKTSRGEETREALVSAAVDIFGREGYRAASTRAIAQAAGANQALIGYHFGGKRGLYLAVFESIVERMTTDLLPAIARVRESLQDLDPNAPHFRQQALASLEVLVSALAKQFSVEGATTWPRLVIREQQDPTEAFDLLYENIYQPLLEQITLLVAALMDLEPEAPQARARAVMIMGQLVVFLAARATALRHMGWSQLGAQELALVGEQLVESIRAQFGEEPRL